jgi:predicted TPR repeat methyltransferase
MHLRGLGYQVPRLLASALQAHGKGPWDIVDLGCGTGQCGTALASLKRRLVGVDLSPRMLAQARALGHYDELATAEVHAWLRHADAASFDVVCAADVLIYIGALEALLREVHRVLRSGGWFAFSTEDCEDRDYELLPTGRYAHSPAYIEALAGSSFAVETALPVVIRVESRAPIPGRIYVLQKR